ncbi:MAG: C25 family cysteine peptidase, partial [Thermoplasmatota archaeon]
TIGNANAIKTYIADYYNTKGLTFVLLVGDAAQVPPYYLSGSASDPSYTYVVGNDHYPDLFIGRFSAENTAQVATQVLRSVEYEKEPQITADWYKKGAGIASSQGPGDDGEYDYQHIRNIRSSLLNYTYILVDELYDGSQGGDDAPGNPTPAMVRDAINNGRSLVNYCGHGSPTSWGTSGFSNTDVNALTNDNMLPFVLSVACNNGEFDTYTCFAEAWMRATHNDEPTGAIGTFMSTVSQSWSPPMEAQDEFNLILVETYPDNKKTTLGGLTANGCMSMNDKYGSSGTAETDYWTLFGDPSLQIRTDTPAEMTVIHDSIITIGSETFEVEVVGVENALCAISSENKLLGYGYTDENGVAIITFFEPIEFMEEAKLVVTAYNKIPYITSIQIGDSYPPSVPEITGPGVGRKNKEYEFTAVSIDPEADQIYYMFDWGDGTQSEWIGPVNSGTEIKINHSWAVVGNYSVKAKAKDVKDSTSKWTEPHLIEIGVPDLKIISLQGGLFNIKMTITNQGIAEADDVNWEIKIDGGLIILGRNSKGTINTIPPGDVVTIHGKMVIGFGKIKTQITFSGPECYYYKERGGSIYLFYIIMNPGG